MTQEQQEYLSNHKWAVLATGRKDGSPQISQIVYHWNGEDFTVSIKSYTAKWNNALRQPRVALLIPDERRQLVIYGSAECIDEDPDRAEMTLRVHHASFDDPDIAVTDDLIKILDRDQRTVFRIRPDKVLDEGFELVED
jgi:PPOX class probable F420-dependent enzyme|tara:strand:- start:1690 stop:2106 length:417 start_codon:yes stop_codon:yes gene_type:complete